MRKRNKKKLSKGSLILAGFLFICLSFFDLKADKNNTDYTFDNSIYTNVSAKELINVMKSQSGLILIVNDNKDIDRLTSILMSFEPNEKIFVYNSSNDEIRFDDKTCKVTKNASNDYKRLISFLGSYADTYKSESCSSDYKYVHSPMVLFAKDGGVLYSYYLPLEEEVTDEILSYVFEKGFSLFNN